jgi:hypothetical protein
LEPLIQRYKAASQKSWILSNTVKIPNIVKLGSSLVSVCQFQN